VNLSRSQQYTVLAVLGVALVVGTMANELMRARTGPGGGGPVATPAGELGPTPGPDAEGYISQKRAHLNLVASSEPGRPAAALVSFSRMLTASEAAALLGGMRHDAVFLRYPGSDAEAATVSGGLEEAVSARAEVLISARTEELADLEARVPGAPPEERTELERQISERRTWVEQMGAGCACVYAVAVRGSTLGSLRELGSRGEVRLVDVPDPPVADLRGWELRPILPAS